MPQADEERDPALDTTEDALLDQELSDEEEEEEEEEGEAEADDSDDDSDDSDEDEESDEDDESEEDDDDKPVTRKELKELLKGKQNDSNAKRRVSGKQPERDIKANTDADKRLEKLESSHKQIELSERKRAFGYENGLSPKQVDFLFRLSKRPTPKFVKQPEIKAALEAISQKERVAKNTPGNSGQRFKTTGGKEKSWSELKPEERQASFADRRAEILARKKG